MKKIIPSKGTVLVGDNGRIFTSIKKMSKVLHVHHERVSKCLKKNGCFYHDDVKYVIVDNDEVYNNDKKENKQEIAINNKDYQKYVDSLEVASLPFEKYDFKLKHHNKGYRYAVALFSDVHLEQRIEKESTLGLNEYTVKIAEQRVKTYFNNLVSCINADDVEELVFGCLGDLIDGYLRDSALVNNELSPLEAVMKGQSLVFEGLRFLCNNTKLKKILFVGIVGNHGRSTPKTWSVGAYKVNYEYLLYKNVQEMCRITNLPVEFNIPCADMALVQMSDGNMFAFMHGESVRGGNGMVGPVATIARHYMKLKRSLDITKIYLGHFHQYIDFQTFMANGSICGMSNYSISNGYAWEPPCQGYEVYDSKNGTILSRRIYCEDR